jgi:tyrosyl-tRNA synthetase
MADKKVGYKFKNMSKIITDEKLIEEILTRSVAEVLPTMQDLKNALLSGKKLRIYVGADATGPQLHIGHATNFMILEKLRRLGHEVIVLFGDFTALIGDPTDKSAARIRLTKAQVEANIKSWKEQIAPILNFKDRKNPAKILRNSKWLAKLKFTNLIELASNFTVQRMLERDMYEKRIEEGKPIHMHEFFYPLMQGYDSVAMDVDLEIGGTDQTFNMLAGRTLQKSYNDREKFVLATTLLVNPKTGKKLMSKSEGGFIALNDSPTEMFGKTMALPDEVIIQVFTDCTYLPLEEIKELEKQMKSWANPRDIKMKLAFELVKIYYSEKAAQEAQENFVKVFSKKETPEEVKSYKVESKKLLEILVETNLASSNSDGRRVIKQGGVKIDNEVIKDVNFNLSTGEHLIQKGKRFFVKVIIG